jgi:hypothetical protein
MPHQTQAFRDRLAEEAAIRPSMIRVVRQLRPQRFEALVDDQVRDYFSTSQLAAIEASVENQVIWEIPAPATYLTELTVARRSH